MGNIWVWIVSMVLGGAGAGWIIIRFSPQSEKFWVLPSAYTAIFLLFYGITALTGFWIRTKFWKKSGRNEMYRASARQGLFFGLMSVAVLTLLSENLFSWWTMGLLFAIFILLEIYAR